MRERSRFNKAISCILPGLIALLTLAATLRGVAAQERPVNVVVINVDDLGWTDLSVQGSLYYETPHIDGLPDGSLGPMHDAYHDIDASPSKTFLINHRDDPAVRTYFEQAVGHRPAEELYAIREDPANMNNLAGDPAFDDVREALSRRLALQPPCRCRPRVFIHLCPDATIPIRPAANG